MKTSKTSFMLVIFALIVLVVVSSNAIGSPAETCWEEKVGNIPMPKTLKDSLQPGSKDEIVKLNPNYKHNYVNEDYTHPTIAEEELSKNPHPALDDSIFFWNNEVKKSQIPHDGRVVYFYEDTLSRAGEKMKLHFKKIDDAKFLPLHVEKAMPATSDKLQVILNLLSVNPKSILAKDIEITMKKCEEKGDKKYCATSLEGMVDYVTSILNPKNNKLMAVSTKQDNGIFMEYTIQQVQRLGGDDKRNMVCHKMINPYAVFFCHDISSTNVYGVSLVGDNQKKTTAIAVCHKDTSSWNPRHYAFEILKSKPGGKPICHFVSVDAIVWFLK